MPKYYIIDGEKYLGSSDPEIASLEEVAGMPAAISDSALNLAIDFIKAGDFAEAEACLDSDI